MEKAKNINVSKIIENKNNEFNIPYQEIINNKLTSISNIKSFEKKTQIISEQNQSIENLNSQNNSKTNEIKIEFNKNKKNKKFTQEYNLK